MKQERLPRHVNAADVDAAEALLLELLAEGPMRPRDLRAEAAQRGFTTGHDAWACAKKRLGVKSTDHGSNVSTWALPGPSFEDQLAAWLDSPAGRFAQYVAGRDRLGPPPGTQLELDDVE